MEPIPLRTLTVLLHRELMLSDPRFKDVGLVKSSIVDLRIVPYMQKTYPELFGNPPKTVEETHVHLFQPLTDTKTSDPCDTTCLVHPDADVAIKLLPSSTLEFIYNESLGHDGCFKAIGAYKNFLKLCPAGQQLSIQIAKEEPVLVDTSSEVVLGFKLYGPKHATIVTIPENKRCMISGMKEGEAHCVLGFPYPGSPVSNEKDGMLVVDMTRMQYGEAGRGSYGENYFLGTEDTFLHSMGKICEKLEYDGHIDVFSSDNESLNSRLEQCAVKVWERWQNRATQGWCEHCGKGGSKLLKCAGCLKLSYCSKEHQRLGWKLHKWTCDFNKKA